jgi:hypothetical protein
MSSPSNTKDVLLVPPEDESEGGVDCEEVECACGDGQDSSEIK